jgi:hypothetical protein
MGQKSAGGIMREDVPNKEKPAPRTYSNTTPKYIATPKPSADTPALPSALPIHGEEKVSWKSTENFAST